MLLERLRERVLAANLELVKRGLVIYTFGNASGIDRDAGLVAIKPSGVPYERMEPQHVVITDLNGKVVEGDMRPSSDVATHVLLYKEFPAIGGVAHTHSRHATAWAQAGREIPCLGTTHADYFRGPVPVTARLTAEEIDGEYELNTGHAIVRRYEGMDPLTAPACLVAGHGPFAWGRSVEDAVHHAVIVEELAAMAFETMLLTPEAGALPDVHRDRHFLRKHGPKASYGQG